MQISSLFALNDQIGQFWYDFLVLMSGPVVLRKREPITFGSELLLFTLKFVFFGRNRVLRQVLVLSIILEVEHTDWFPQVNLLSVLAYRFLHN